MQNDFPSQLPLSGSDYFHLFLDHHAKNRSGTGNIGRFVVKVEGAIHATIITEKLKSDAFLRWTGSLFVKKSFLFATPFWVAKKEAHIRFQEFFISEKDNLPDEIPVRDISPETPPLIHLD